MRFRKRLMREKGPSLPRTLWLLVRIESGGRRSADNQRFARRSGFGVGVIFLQDLSLAGNGAGLDGTRSGTFRPFWQLVRGLVREGRAPKLVVLENVSGVLTSHSGGDFSSIVHAFAESGYRVGALGNASRFLPQSRPRVFIVGVHDHSSIPSRLISSVPSGPWHSKSLVKAHEQLPEALARSWIWWALPTPTNASRHWLLFLKIVEPESPGTPRPETQTLLRMMTATHRKELRMPVPVEVGTLGQYKRTRPNQSGVMVQRAEVRFDGI